jgi:hypothetical protein
MRSLPFLALLFAACTVEASPDAPPSASLDPDVDPQLAPGEASWSNEPIPEQTGTFHIVFAFVPNEPSGGSIDAVVGLSKGAATKFTDLGPAVRFSPVGTLDVRNGSAYAADAAFSYRAGETYQIRMDIDLARHRYSVAAEENGGRTTQLAYDYEFRAEQANLSVLDNVARVVDSPTGSLQQIAVEVTPSSTP